MWKCDSEHIEMTLRGSYSEEGEIIRSVFTTIVFPGKVLDAAAHPLPSAERSCQC